MISDKLKTTWLSCLALCLLGCCVRGASLRDDDDSGENEVIKPDVLPTSFPLPAVPPSALEAYYYKSFADITNQDTDIIGRPGNSTLNSSCTHVRSVPNFLRDLRLMRPRGISAIYHKYTEAYGIPVLGSSRVPDAALSRACYVLRFLLAGRQDLREEYYKAYGRVAVLASGEHIRDLPEYSFLPQAFDTATRGLGAIPMAPVSSAAEENVLCYRSGEDMYSREDIMIRELAEGIFHLAARRVLPGMEEELQDLHRVALSSSKWDQTYAQHTPASYLGEGVQSYFNVNGYSSPPDGTHNHVNKRVKLRGYDPALSRFIQRLFPCANRYIKRCRSRGSEHFQVLDMDCHYRVDHIGRSGISQQVSRRSRGRHS